MNMGMYWSQQEVFLMGVLSLFPDKIKNVPLARDKEWQHYFGNKEFEQLAQQLTKYKEAGYIEFDKKTQKIMLIEVGRPMRFDSILIAFTITEINTTKVTDDLTEYLENYCNNKLLTNTVHKPDDSVYQHEKLHTALARIYGRQSLPRVTASDIFGDGIDHEPPFWETVLAPQFVNGQYRIRQMNNDTDSPGQSFVDIEITDPKFSRSLELVVKSSEPISDEDPEETPPYKGLQARRDGLIYYNNEEVSLTPQQREVVRVLLKRPDELRLKEVFIDPEASIFNLSRKNYPNINETLAQLISATHKKLRIAIGKECVFNTPNQGWKLKL